MANRIKNNFKIKIIGVGGCGCNLVDSMVKNKLQHSQIIAMNTDFAVLSKSIAPYKIQIGKNLTKGAGAGKNPETGKKAALENETQIKEITKNTDLLFILCGMGGGTGTGASPVIAKIAKENNAFVIGIVTFPFEHEGKVREDIANDGIYEFKKYGDSIIVVPNEKLLEEKGSIQETWELGDQIIFEMVERLIDIVVSSGKINIDFADLKNVMTEPGEIKIGIGRAKGKEKINTAIKKALNYHTLVEKNIKEASAILINIVTDNSIQNLSKEENDAAAIKYIKEIAQENTNIIIGTEIRKDLQDEAIVTIIASGVKKEKLSEEEKLKIPTFKRKKDLWKEYIKLQQKFF